MCFAEVFKRVAQWKMVGSLGLVDGGMPAGGGGAAGGFDHFEL